MFKTGDKVRLRDNTIYLDFETGKIYEVNEADHFLVLLHGNDSWVCSRYFELLNEEKGENVNNLAKLKIDAIDTQGIKESLDNATSRIKELENQLDEVRNTKDIYKRLYEDSKNEIDDANNLLTLFGVQEKIFNDGQTYTKLLPLVTRISLYAVNQNKNAN